MKRYCLHTACIVLVLLVAMLVINSAYAQTSIAVVDMQKILTESLAARDIQKQMQTHREKFQKEFSKVEQDLRENQKTLSEQQTSLSQEEFAKKRGEFEQKLHETRNTVRNRKQSLDAGFTKAMKDLENEIFKIVESISSEKGYELVLTRSSVFLGSNSLDISDEVMSKLNSSLTKVKLKIENK